MPSVSGITRENIWTRQHQGLDSRRPVRRGCSREALHEWDGMRRPASLCMHTVAREAHGRHRPCAATGGSCERTSATSKGTAHGGKRRKNVRFEPKPMIAFKNISYTPILHLRRGERKRTSRWPAAVERREASIPRRADGESLPARGHAGQRYWSAHNTGCRCTRAPFGAPLPSRCEGDWQSSEEICLARRTTRACDPEALTAS